jgi:hypothetical protein
MTSAEAMVLATATILSVAVLAEGRDGSTLNPRVGKFLLGLAVLAAFAALLHMVAP